MIMNYDAIWRVLSDLITEFNKKGVRVPPQIINDLRSSKTMIQVLKADPSCTECIPRLQSYLENVESYLILEAQEKFGADFAERWMRKIETARRLALEEELEAEAPRFVTDVPRDKFWVRIQISEDIPKEMLENLTKEFNLSYKLQENNYLLVFGEKQNVKSFIRKIAQHMRRKNLKG